MLNQFRISLEPSKTLLWLWLKNSLSTIKKKGTGVDLAGGSMFNKRFFKTDKYICVDINKIKLKEGKARYPDAKIINSSIQEYLKNINERPDVLVCMQTMGINGLFDHNETLKIIREMYKVLNIGGSIIFNVGANEIDINKVGDELNNFLNGKFEKIEKKYYGTLFNRPGIQRWKFLNNKKRTVVRISKTDLNTKEKILKNFYNSFVNKFKYFLSISLALVMHFCIPLRTLFGLKKNRVYFACKKKLFI